MEPNDLIFKIITVHYGLHSNLDPTQIREEVAKRGVSMSDESLENRINEFKASRNFKLTQN
jgi:hypothetical protein